MRIAYFLNIYPMTSLTFIRGEILALEAAGVEILRVALRRWDAPLVTPVDRQEQAKTRYLLDRKAGLILGLVREAAANPRGMARALGAWRRLVANAGGKLVAHGAYLAEAVALKRLCRAERIDHVHTHFGTNSAAVAMLCHLMGGPSYSFTAHGPTEFYDRQSASVGLKVRHASFVAAISHFCRTQLLQAAGIEGWDDAMAKIHIVRCGVDLDAFAPQPPPAPDAPLVHVGRLCVAKAQSLIPAAVARAARHHPGIRVQIVGDGELRPMVEAAIAAHGVAAHVELMGWQSHERVRDLVAGSRAFLLPSFAEGIPVVIMEAMALGRPVITTAIAGIPELVTPECGWVVPSGDAEALGRALDEALAASPERLAEMGAAGRARVAAMHDITANAMALKARLEATPAGRTAAGAPPAG
ncbi:MAG: glycosyltransferase family 4 protein [Pseudomonadota bacterium]